jgi:hypothetical protein
MELDLGWRGSVLVVGKVEHAHPCDPDGEVGGLKGPGRRQAGVELRPGAPVRAAKGLLASTQSGDGTSAITVLPAASLRMRW